MSILINKETKVICQGFTVLKEPFPRARQWSMGQKW